MTTPTPIEQPIHQIQHAEHYTEQLSINVNPHKVIIVKATVEPVSDDLDVEYEEQLKAGEFSNIPNPTTILPKGFDINKVVTTGSYSPDFMQVLDIVDGWYHEHTRHHLIDINPNAKDMINKLVSLIESHTKRARQESELIGVAKLLDSLWDNSYYSLGKATSDRIKEEMTYFFGESWTSTMYDFMQRDGESLPSRHPVPVKTLAELEKETP